MGVDHTIAGFQFLRECRLKVAVGSGLTGADVLPLCWDDGGYQAQPKTHYRHRVGCSIVRNRARFLSYPSASRSRVLDAQDQYHDANWLVHDL